MLVSAGGVATYATYDLATSFTDEVVDVPEQGAVPPDIGAIEGGVNILVTGIDECEEEFAYLFGARCTGPDRASRLNDVNLLVHISANPRRVTVVSFPRDLVVTLPPCTRADGSAFAGGVDQINTAYMYGGLGCVINTVSAMSGMNIPFGAVVTFGGVIKVTDAIGGVDVCLARGIRDRDMGLNLPAGTHTISGVTALQFLRTRRRRRRQRPRSHLEPAAVHVAQLARKLMSEEVLSDPARLFKLASVALDNVTPTRRSPIPSPSCRSRSP